MEGAIEYHVYRSTSAITNINDLILTGIIPITTLPNLTTNFIDINQVEGTYYYAVFASNLDMTSEASNCVSVTIDFSADDDAPDDLLLEISIIIAGVAIALAIVVHGVMGRSRPGTPPPPKKAPVESKKEGET